MFRVKMPISNDWTVVLLLSITIGLQCTDVFDQQSDINCRVSKMKSTCPNDEVSKWNKKNIGMHLKLWIKSISFECRPGKFEAGNTINCGKLFITKNDFFRHYGPDAISDQMLIFGNINRRQKLNSEELVRNIGPAWVDLNNPDDWNITMHSKDELLINLHKKAALRNGFYYGELNDETLTLGKIIMQSENKNVLFLLLNIEVL